MKSLIKFSVYFIVFIVLSGCTYRPNVEPRYLSDNILLKLNANHAVALINSSQRSGEVKLCGAGGIHTVVGDNYVFTETAVAVAKKTLERNNIRIDNTADNKIELSVQPSCVFAMSKNATVILKVRTGSGLEKEYTSLQQVGHPGQYAPAFEKAVSDCVEQMLLDKDIKNYLET